MYLCELFLGTGWNPLVISQLSVFKTCTFSVGLCFIFTPLMMQWGFQTNWYWTKLLKQWLQTKCSHLKLLLGLKLCFRYLSALYLNSLCNILISKAGETKHSHTLPTVTNNVKWLSPSTLCEAEWLHHTKTLQFLSFCLQVGIFPLMFSV